MQSSTALDPSWRPISPEQALIFSSMFAKLLECDQDDFDTLNCLQSKDMVDVLMLSELNEVLNHKNIQACIIVLKNGARSGPCNRSCCEAGV